jgi:phenylalanyl-tRNA synthetase beta chain
MLGKAGTPDCLRRTQRGRWSKSRSCVASTTLYPKKGDPFTIKLAKIRGEQSEGMICAEDEIGLSDNHDGIIVLDTNVPPERPHQHSMMFTRIIFLKSADGLTVADAASHIGDSA